MNLALIIDDSNICSFIVQSVIKETKKFQDSVIQPSGFSAVEYLVQSMDNPQKYPWPSLILLDMQMPVVDGHKFLEDFERLPFNKRGQTTLVMMSNSDKDNRIEDYINERRVSRFIAKPFRVKDMNEILDKF